MRGSMGSRSGRPNTALVGIAGVHYVVSELSRRGLIALPTVRNTAAYDVVVVSPDGRRHAMLQVKASSKRVSFFRMPLSSRIKTGPHDFYVLVRWLTREHRYQGFMLTGAEAKAEVKRRERVQRSRGRSLVPCVSVTRGPSRARRWEQRWLRWSL